MVLCSHYRFKKLNYVFIVYYETWDFAYCVSYGCKVLQKSTFKNLTQSFMSIISYL